MPDRVDGLSVRFRFLAGWCNLSLTANSISRSFRATAINDAFANLAKTIADLADVEHETRLGAVLWGDEPGGVFLDFATVATDHIALVAHSMVISNWIVGTAAPDWMPIRGEVLFTYLAPRREVIAEFLAGFTKAGESSNGGSFHEWGHAYPVVEVSRIRDALNK